ncbi:uncharacterized protein [Rutidosis leptorrhynchoides]|uniref:uncharacterized protein n=1 Tax=Rutidosis leptorrhynchoides TaxID=125765 RepID=UPI003A99EE2E
MGHPISDRSTHNHALRNKIELEKRRNSYANLHYEDVKNRLNTSASPYMEKREIERGEIIRNMSILPSFLDPMKATPDRALSFGVMDWGRLEKWRYQHLQSSPSSSISSPFFSAHGSTPQSTRSQCCSPAPQTPHRVTLQSHFNTSSCLKNVNKFQDFKDAAFYKKKTEPEDCSISELSVDMGNCQTKLSCLKGKMKIQNEPRTRNSCSTSGNNTPDEKRSSFCSVKSDLKQRYVSPVRRFSFSKKRDESPVSRKSAVDNTFVSNRSSLSPLRRLIEPIFPLRKSTEIPRDGSKIKAKSRLDLSNYGEAIKNDDLDRNGTTKAFFQTAVKNGRLLFTFAVENDNILAATVRDLSSAEKDNNNRWIYTFFTVDEIKKKNGSWFSHSKKDKGDTFVPNMAAQMTVSTRSVSNCDTREFSLYRVDPNRVDELAGIVVKFSGNVVDEENQVKFSTTVILPGGKHGVSSNGRPSPLIERWRSGGGCDCGGWDLGCRLRTLTNQVQSSRRSDGLTDQFELFCEGDVTNERCFFSLRPLKDGIYSTEYNSSLSPFQAFSICISVIECRKSSQLTDSRTYVAKQVEDDSYPVRFASFPPLSPVGRV